MNDDDKFRIFSYFASDRSSSFSGASFLLPLAVVKKITWPSKGYGSYKYTLYPPYHKDINGMSEISTPLSARSGIRSRNAIDINGHVVS